MQRQASSLEAQPQQQQQAAKSDWEEQDGGSLEEDMTPLEEYELSADDHAEWVSEGPEEPPGLVPTTPVLARRLAMTPTSVSN